MTQESGTWRCVVCGQEDIAGLGYWACHTDEDVTPVHTGRCFHIYQAGKAEAKALGFWTALYPELASGGNDEASEQAGEQGTDRAQLGR